MLYLFVISWKGTERKENRIVGLLWSLIRYSFGGGIFFSFLLGWERIILELHTYFIYFDSCQWMRETKERVKKGNIIVWRRGRRGLHVGVSTFSYLLTLFFWLVSPSSYHELSQGVDSFRFILDVRTGNWPVLGREKGYFRTEDWDVLQYSFIYCKPPFPR